LRLFLCLLFLSSLSCTSVQEKPETPLHCHRNYNTIALKKELHILSTTLQEAHPSLYRYTSKEELEQHVQKLKEELEQKDSLSYLNFLEKVAKLLTKIACSNTHWSHSKAYIDYRNANIPLFPIDLKIRNKRFFVTANWSNENAVMEGDEILEINKEKVATYLKKNYSLLPVEGQIRSLQERWLESYFPQHHSNFWEQCDTFHLRIRKPNGNIQQESVIALNHETLKQRRQKRNKDSLEYEQRDSIAYLKIPSFSQDLAPFLDSVFSSINRHNTRLLLLDLRGNSWGKLTEGQKLMRYLVGTSFKYISSYSCKNVDQFSFVEHIQLPSSDSLFEKLNTTISSHKNAFLGKLYLLTNGWNINAGGYFCAKIAERENTFFLGETPGNAAFGINTHPIRLHLPTSEIDIYIPLCRVLARPPNENSSKALPLTKLPKEATKNGLNEALLLFDQ
jgi:hypothetical protein